MVKLNKIYAILKFKFKIDFSRKALSIYLAYFLSEIYKFQIKNNVLKFDF